MSPPHAPNDAAIDRLEAITRGEVLEPERSSDGPRGVWHGWFDKDPTVIIGGRDAEDVRAALDFSRARSLPLSVNGAGHDDAG